MAPARRLAPTLLLALTIACRTTTPPPAIDPEMAACVPADTTLLAAVDVDRLRASPLYAQLPPAAAAYLAPFADAHRLLIADAALFILRGPFRESPPAATLLTKTLALIGPPDAITAATAQHRTGQPGAPALLADAATVARTKAAIWIVTRGPIPFPLTGNLANLNRLLRDTESATLAANLADRVDLFVTARTRTPEAASNLEETLRAILTLAAVANARAPDLAQALCAAQVTHDDRTVRATLSASPSQIQKLLAH